MRLRPQQCACRLQVLNAMLLACSGNASEIAVQAMQYLLQEGAVPDTWAPNGSSVSYAFAFQCANAFMHSIDFTRATRVLIVPHSSHSYPILKAVLLHDLLHYRKL